MTLLYANSRGRLRRKSPTRDAKHAQLREELGEHARPNTPKMGAAIRKGAGRVLTQPLDRVRMWWTK